MSIPDWEDVFPLASYGCCLQKATHVPGCLGDVVKELEAVAGLHQTGVLPASSWLDGIETSVRQLVRQTPLEVRAITYRGRVVQVPTDGEILRIKAVLILSRNGAQDYADFVALAVCLGEAGTAKALYDFDRFYPQPSGESALQQLLDQLASAMPYDLKERAGLAPDGLQDWNAVRAACLRLAVDIFDLVCQAGPKKVKSCSTKPVHQ